MTNRLKEIRRETDPTTINAPLENHHYMELKCRNGTEVFPLTKPEHCLSHLIDAQRGIESEVNYWAVQKIIQRMEPQELDEFNQMISNRRKRKYCT